MALTNEQQAANIKELFNLPGAVPRKINEMLGFSDAVTMENAPQWLKDYATSVAPMSYYQQKMAELKPLLLPGQTEVLPTIGKFANSPYAQALKALQNDPQFVAGKSLLDYDGPASAISQNLQFAAGSPLVATGNYWNANTASDDKGNQLAYSADYGFTPYGAAGGFGVPVVYANQQYADQMPQWTIKPQDETFNPAPLVMAGILGAGALSGAGLLGGAGEAAAAGAGEFGGMGGSTLADLYGGATGMSVASAPTAATGSALYGAATAPAALGTTLMDAVSDFPTSGISGGGSSSPYTYNPPDLMGPTASGIPLDAAAGMAGPTQSGWTLADALGNESVAGQLSGATGASSVFDLIKQYGQPAAKALGLTNADGSINWSAIGNAGAGIAGYFAAQDQSDQFMRLANEFKEFGAPSRARYESSYKPGFTMANDPGYTDALNQASKATLHGLSATGQGNPADNPNAWAQSLRDNYEKTAYPALKDYRTINATTGGLTGGNLQYGANLQSNAINSNAAGLNALGSAANNIFNPPQTTAQQFAQLSQIFK